MSDLPNEGKNVRSSRAHTGLDVNRHWIGTPDRRYRSAIREHLKGHTQGLEDLAIEMLARGLSVRDIEDAFKDETGRLLLSKTAVSQLGERLWEDYQAFAQRDLSDYRSPTCSLTGLPNDCALVPNATRFWQPGDLPRRAVGCCCI
jgi:hypothetical protein